MSKAIDEKINVVKRYLPKCNSVYNCYTYGSNGVQGVQTRLKRKDRFESK